MKWNGNRNLARLVVAALGLTGFALRWTLYRVGLDEKGLLKEHHPLEIALILVTALTAALIWLAVRKMDKSGTYEDHFVPSLPAGMGEILCAAGIALTVLLNVPLLPGPVGQLWKLTGILSAPLLLWSAFSRVAGKKPFVLCHVVVSVFFALHLVVHYQLWCSDPQLQNYVFAFLGSIGLMFCAYHHASFAAGLGKPRTAQITGLLTAYLCMVSLACTEYLYLYLGGALWAITGLCWPKPKAGEADGDS